MSRRGKRDDAVTKHLYEAGFFTHPKSFVGKDGHPRLEGMDKARVRPFVFKRHKNHCVICGHKLYPESPLWSDTCGNWHHPNPSWDDVESSELRCDPTTGRKCHAHGTSGFQRKAEAVEDSNRIYGDE